MLDHYLLLELHFSLGLLHLLRFQADLNCWVFLPPAAFSDPPELPQLSSPSISIDESCADSKSDDELHEHSDGESLDSHPDNSANECTGILVKWRPGSVWDTYPYQQHEVQFLSLRGDRGYPYMFFLEPLPVPVNTVPVWLRVRVYHGYRGVFVQTHGYFVVSTGMP